jgi:arylsulfatase A-like enzyme
LSVDTEALTASGFDEHRVWTGALLGEGNSHQRWQAFLKAGKKHELESRYWDPVVYRNGRRMTLPGRFGPDVYADFLIDFMQRERDQPFVAYYATPLVHIPTVTTPHSPNPEAPEREQFAGMVRYLDHQVGRLVAELERLSLRDDTIIIFTTDNGSPKRLAGMVGGRRASGGLGSLSEGGLDVPLVVNCPARIAQGRVQRALVDCTDFLPTMVELASVELPRDRVIDGRSFAAELRGNAQAPLGREWIFAQLAETRVVRDRRFKLYSTGELFDLTADPLEKTHLARSFDPEVVAARARLQKVLHELPADAHLPFPPRSSSAFQLEAARQKSRSK